MSLINSTHYLNKPGKMQYKNEQHYSTEELLHESHTLPTPSHLALDNLPTPTSTAMTSKKRMQHKNRAVHVK